jgi:hypothetical protein
MYKAGLGLVQRTDCLLNNLKYDAEHDFSDFAGWLGVDHNSTGDSPFVWRPENSGINERAGTRDEGV